jgi:hypothetical protein
MAGFSKKGVKTIFKDHAVRSLRARGGRSPPDSGLRVMFFINDCASVTTNGNNNVFV